MQIPGNYFEFGQKFDERRNEVCGRHLMVSAIVICTRGAALTMRICWWWCRGLYTGADCYVLPFRGEGFAITVTNSCTCTVGFCIIAVHRARHTDL